MEGVSLFESAAVALGGLFCFRKPVAPLPPLNPGDLPTLKAGYYGLEKADNLGPLFQGPLFLAPQLYVETNWRGTARRAFAGIAGALSAGGFIRSTWEKEGVVHWASLEGARCAIRLRADPAGAWSLIASTGSSGLAYLGRRLPSDPFPVGFLAHRGTHCLTPPPINPEGLYPANTPGAFQDALTTGYGGFEADVRVSKDGQFIVNHDENLRSGTDGVRRIQDTPWSAMEGLTVRGTPVVPERRWSLLKSYFFNPLARLRDVLTAHLPDPRVERLVVDVKPDHKERIADAASKAFKGIPDEEIAKVVFLCELPEALRLLKKLFPRSTCALEGRRGTEPLSELDRFIPELQGGERSHDAISLNLGIPLAHPTRDIAQVRRVLEAASRYGYPVVGWTIGSPSELDVLRKEQLYPDLLLSDLRYTEIALRCLLGGKGDAVES